MEVKCVNVTGISSIWVSKNNKSPHGMLGSNSKKPFSALQGGEGFGMRWAAPVKELRPKTIIARKLRLNATDVERKLWRALRESGLPWRFRRQHPIGRYIADFACPARKLVIELDGGQHAAQEETDDVRTAELARYGYRVIRFWNNDVVENLDGVMETIKRALEAPPPHPTLSAPEGGEGFE
jgi:very-short-patch-repair endonuclease